MVNKGEKRIVRKEEVGLKNPRFTPFAVSMTVMTGAAWVHAQPRSEKPVPGVLANGQIVKSSNGIWKCLSKGGRPCSAVEWAAAVKKLRSSARDNFALASDGTLKCTKEGKPCPETAFKELSEAVTRAIHLEKKGAF
jgi:hypothetical protein